MVLFLNRANICQNAYSGIVNLGRLGDIVTWNAGIWGVAQAAVTVRQTAKDRERNSR
jgi:hypothetical protein